MSIITQTRDVFSRAVDLGLSFRRDRPRSFVPQGQGRRNRVFIRRHRIDWAALVPLILRLSPGAPGGKPSPCPTQYLGTPGQELSRMATKSSPKLATSAKSSASKSKTSKSPDQQFQQAR